MIRYVAVMVLLAFSVSACGMPVVKRETPYASASEGGSSGGFWILVIAGALVGAIAGAIAASTTSQPGITADTKNTDKAPNLNLGIEKKATVAEVAK